jgi:hypothetical protein
MKVKKIINDYENICNKIAHKFAKKQKIDFDGWVGDEIGGTAVFATQYYFNIDDIVLDIKTKQPKGFILQWQDEMIDFNIGKHTENFKNINYKSFTMGLRLKDIE